MIEAAGVIDAAGTGADAGTSGGDGHVNGFRVTLEISSFGESFAAVTGVVFHPFVNRLFVSS